MRFGSCGLGGNERVIDEIAEKLSCGQRNGAGAVKCHRPSSRQGARMFHVKPSGIRHRATDRSVEPSGTS
jgi:hypothetical protein